MFRKNTLITKGINEQLDINVIIALWELVQGEYSRKLDYLQIFELKNVGTTEEPMLKIVWKQEQPEHIETYYVKGLVSSVEKVWIICSGEGTADEYSTMLLPEEY